MSAGSRDKAHAIRHNEFTWLLNTHRKVAPNIRAELLKTINEPIKAACILHLCTFSAACLTYLTTSSFWSLLWACSEAIVAPTRIFLLRLLQASSSIDIAAFTWLNRITALWFFSLGLAAFGSVHSNNIALAIITSNLIIALQGGIASRLASTPRLATLLSILLISPTILGIWAVDEKWAYTIPIAYILCFFGMHQLTKQNHKILLDKISAEHKNLVLLMRDPLTGLANRRKLRDQLQAFNSSPIRSYGLLCIDLDGFKAVNDQYGHLAGDQLLIAVSQRITSKLRSDDLACRVGGDEFIVILVDIDEDCAKRRAAELITILSAPFKLPIGITACIGASIGIALNKSRKTPMESIVKQADDALYQAKRAGKGTYKLADS